MATYYVLGKEVFNFAEIKGIHVDKKEALKIEKELRKKKKYSLLPEICCDEFNRN